VLRRFRGVRAAVPGSGRITMRPSRLAVRPFRVMSLAWWSVWL
jgi:hypothetical protein